MQILRYLDRYPSNVIEARVWRQPNQRLWSGTPPEKVSTAVNWRADFNLQRLVTLVTCPGLPARSMFLSRETSCQQRSLSAYPGPYLDSARARRGPRIRGAAAEDSELHATPGVACG